jgi:hypothetical protein
VQRGLQGGGSVGDSLPVPQCREGSREEGVLETPSHLLSAGRWEEVLHLVSGVGLLRPDWGAYLELVLEDRTVFLYRAINRRKELGKKLRIKLEGRKDPASHGAGV